MKKLFLSVLLVAGITALAPKAQAWDQRRIIYYNEYGRPVYGYVNDDDNCDYRSRYVSYNGGYYDNYQPRYYQPRWEHHRRHNVGFSFFFGR